MKPNHDRRSETGSAYIVALLVLVVLSIIGLALSLVSQSELQIGANELTTHRALYGAEAGIHLAIARVLTVNSSVDNATVTAVEPMAFTLPESRFAYDATGNPIPRTPGPNESRFGERVQVTPFVPIHQGPCDGCQHAVGDVNLLNVDYAVVANSERITWTGADDKPNQATIDAAARSAQKELYVTIGLSPFWAPKWEAIADEIQVRKVRQENPQQQQPN